MSSASEKVFLWVFGGFVCCRTPSEKGVFQYTRIHSLHVNWCRLSVESRALTCPSNQSKFKYLVTVELSSHTYTPLSETLCLFKAFFFHRHGPAE